MFEVDYHPADDLLSAYAAGTLLPGIELLVSGHLTFCASCRKTVAKYEVLGGAALDVLEQADVVAPDISGVLGLLDAEPEIMATPPKTSAVLPVQFQDLLKGGVDDINWSFRLPGIYEHEIDGFDGEQVSLLKARPGAKMLAHTHEGTEATLILAGEMADGDAVYRKGDVAFADGDHDHRPQIVGTETCICLIVMSGNLRFTGRVGRALNVLIR